MSFFRITKLLALGVGVAASGLEAASAAGTVASWGVNDFGQLGNNAPLAPTPPPQVSPVLLHPSIPAGKTVTQVSAGGQHSCAVTADGLAYCWGANGVGQLGDNNASGEASSIPVAVLATGAVAGKALVQISVGTYHSCAVAADGGAYCWGSNDFGQLGNPLPGPSSNVPSAVFTSGDLGGGPVTGVLNGKKVVQISAGGQHSCAITSEGRGYCWGDNSYGQLGNISSDPFSLVPVEVTATGALAGKILTQIAAGEAHSCAVASDGGADCWGSNGSGQLGDGAGGNFGDQSAAPVAVFKSGALNGAPTFSGLAGKSVTQIAAGFMHTCALSSDGGAYCWGDNSVGQLGNGVGAQSSLAVAVDTSGALNRRSVTQISAGFAHNCAATSDGAVACWGLGNEGELGDGSNFPSMTPVAVDKSGVLSGKFVWQADAGSYHTAAVAPACGPGIDLTSGPTAQWHAFSLPQTPSASPATVANVFGTGTPTNLTTTQYNVANPAAGTGWVLFRRNPVTNTNVRLAATDVLTPGEGYWIKSFQATRTGKLFVGCSGATPPATVTRAQGCSSVNGCFAIPLNTTRGASGYLVGNPFPWGIDWSKVRVRVNGSATTFTPSQAAGLAASGNASPAVLGNTFWVWNGTSYDSFSDAGPTQGSLPYQKSFWVDVLAGAQGRTVELLIPKDPTTLAQ